MDRNELIRAWRAKNPNSWMLPDSTAFYAAVRDAQDSGEDVLADTAIKNEFQDIKTENAPGLLTEGTSAFKAGVDQAQAKLYGVAEMAGDAAGLSSVSRWGNEGRKRNEQEAAAEWSPTVGSVNDIRSPKEFAYWLTGLVGSQAPVVGATVAAGAATAALAPEAAAGAGIAALIAPAIIGFTQSQNYGELKDAGGDGAMPLAVANGLIGSVLNIVGPYKATLRAAAAQNIGKKSVDGVIEAYINSVPNPLMRTALYSAKEGNKEMLANIVQEAALMASESISQHKNHDYKIDPAAMRNRLVEAGVAGFVMGGGLGLAEGYGRSKKLPEVAPVATPTATSAPIAKPGIAAPAGELPLQPVIPFTAEQKAAYMPPASTAPVPFPAGTKIEYVGMQQPALVGMGQPEPRWNVQLPGDPRVQGLTASAIQKLGFVVPEIPSAPVATARAPVDSDNPSPIQASPSGAVPPSAATAPAPAPVTPSANQQKVPVTKTAVTQAPVAAAPLNIGKIELPAEAPVIDKPLNLTEIRSEAAKNVIGIPISDKETLASVPDITPPKPISNEPPMKAPEQPVAPAAETSPNQNGLQEEKGRRQEVLTPAVVPTEQAGTTEPSVTGEATKMRRNSLIGVAPAIDTKTGEPIFISENQQILRGTKLKGETYRTSRVGAVFVKQDGSLAVVPLGRSHGGNPIHFVRPKVKKTDIPGIVAEILSKKFNTKVGDRTVDVVLRTGKEGSTDKTRALYAAIQEEGAKQGWFDDSPVDMTRDEVKAKLGAGEPVGYLLFNDPLEPGIHNYPGDAKSLFLDVSIARAKAEAGGAWVDDFGAGKAATKHAPTITDAEGNRSQLVDLLPTDGGHVANKALENTARAASPKTDEVLRLVKPVQEKLGLTAPSPDVLPPPAPKALSVLKPADPRVEVAKTASEVRVSLEDSDLENLAGEMTKKQIAKLLKDPMSFAEEFRAYLNPDAKTEFDLLEYSGQKAAILDALNQINQLGSSYHTKITADQARASVHVQADIYSAVVREGAARGIDISLSEKNEVSAKAIFRIEGGAVSPDASNRTALFVLKNILSPTAQDLRVALHEILHDQVKQMPDWMQNALHDAIERLPDADKAFYMNPDADWRVRTGDNPASLPKAVLTLERTIEHLTVKGVKTDVARNMVASFWRTAKDLFYRAALWVQKQLVGEENVSGKLALAYANNLTNSVLAGDMSRLKGFAARFGAKPTFGEIARHVAIGDNVIVETVDPRTGETKLPTAENLTATATKYNLESIPAEAKMRLLETGLLKRAESEKLLAEALGSEDLLHSFAASKEELQQIVEASRERVLREALIDRSVHNQLNQLFSSLFERAKQSDDTLTFEKFMERFPVENPRETLAASKDTLGAVLKDNYKSELPEDFAFDLLIDQHQDPTAKAKAEQKYLTTVRKIVERIQARVEDNRAESLKIGAREEYFRAVIAAVDSSRTDIKKTFQFAKDSIRESIQEIRSYARRLGKVNVARGEAEGIFHQLTTEAKRSEIRRAHLEKFLEGLGEKDVVEAVRHLRELGDRNQIDLLTTADELKTLALREAEQNPNSPLRAILNVKDTDNVKSSRALNAAIRLVLEGGEVKEDGTLSVPSLETSLAAFENSKAQLEERYNYDRLLDGINVEEIMLPTIVKALHDLCDVHGVDIDTVSATDLKTRVLDYVRNNPESSMRHLVSIEGDPKGTARSTAVFAAVLSFIRKDAHLAELMRVQMDTSSRKVEILNRLGTVLNEKSNEALDKIRQDTVEMKLPGDRLIQKMLNKRDQSMKALRRVEYLNSLGSTLERARDALNQSKGELEHRRGVASGVTIHPGAVLPDPTSADMPVAQLRTSKFTLQMDKAHFLNPKEVIDLARRYDAWINANLNNPSARGEMLNTMIDIRAKLRVAIGSEKANATISGMLDGVFNSVPDWFKSTGTQAGAMVQRMFVKSNEIEVGLKNRAHTLGMKWERARADFMKASGLQASTAHELFYRPLRSFMERSAGLTEEEAYVRLRQRFAQSPELHALISKPGAWNALVNWGISFRELNEWRTKASVEAGNKVRDESLVGANVHTGKDAAQVRNPIEEGVAGYTAPNRLHESITAVIRTMDTRLFSGDGPMNPFDNIAIKLNLNVDEYAQSLAAVMTPEVRKAFLDPLITNDHNSSLPQPRRVDGNNFALPYDVAERLWRESNGDLVSFAKKVYAERGVEGLETETEYAARMIDWVGSKLRDLHTQVNVTGDTNRTSLLGAPHYAMDARSFQDYPREWIDPGEDTAAAARHQVKTIALNAAFGRDMVDLNAAIDAVHGELIAKVNELGATPEERAAAREAHKNEKGWYEERVAAEKKLSGMGDIKRVIGDINNPTKGLQAESGLASDVFSTVLTGLLSGPKAGLSQAATLFDSFAVERSVSGGSAMTIGKNVSNMLKYFAGSVSSVFGVDLLSTERNLIAIKNAGGFDKAADLTNKEIATIDRGSHAKLDKSATGRVQEILRTLRAVVTDTKIGRTGGVTPGFKANPFQLMQTLSNYSVTSSFLDRVRDFARRGAEYYTENPERVGELLTAEKLGIGDKTGFAAWKDELVTHGIVLEQLAEKGIGAAPNAELLDTETVRSVMNIVGSRVAGEANATNRPSYMLTSRFAKMNSSLLGWSFFKTGTLLKMLRDPQNRTNVMTLLNGLKVIGLGLIPASVAFSYLMDEYDEKMTGKRSNLRDISSDDLLGSILERAAAVGTFGVAGSVIDTVKNVKDGTGQKLLSVDQRIVWLNSVITLMKSISDLNAMGGFENANYANFYRRVMQAGGMGGLLQYVQVANKMFEIDAPLFKDEASVTARINANNFLRAAGRDVGLEIKQLGGAATPTPLTPWVTNMALAAYMNDPEKFMDVYRRAVEVARKMGKEDPAKSVAESFATRNPLKSVFNVPPTPQEYQQLLTSMPEEGQRAVRQALSLFNNYAARIGANTFVGSDPNSPGNVARLRAKRLESASDSWF